MSEYKRQARHDSYALTEYVNKTGVTGEFKRTLEIECYHDYVTEAAAKELILDLQDFIANVMRDKDLVCPHCEEKLEQVSVRYMDTVRLDVERDGDVAEAHFDTNYSEGADIEEVTCPECGNEVGDLVEIRDV